MAGEMAAPHASESLVPAVSEKQAVERPPLLLLAAVLATACHLFLELVEG
jgi:hypothetical protein